MVERDPLTGLANRRTFDAEHARAVTDPRGAALVVFDLDGFKAVDDKLGHPVGDAVLGIGADACSSVVREGDRLARAGGAEFPPEVSGLGAIASAVAPLDALTAPDLFDCAQRRWALSFHTQIARRSRS